MALRKILTDGDPILAQKSHPVTKFDRKLHILLDDMKETLTKANGLGLAAPQIGILRRCVIVVDETNQMVELINPEIIEYSEETEENLEGCLSVPGKWGMVVRPLWAKVRAQDRDGNFFEKEGEDITARCFFHEIDHLNGHLFSELAPELFTQKELDEMMGEDE